MTCDLSATEVRHQSRTRFGPTQANQKKKSEEQPTGSGKSNGDTPLDALFQMTTKDFDESQGKHHPGD